MPKSFPNCLPLLMAATCPPFDHLRSLAVLHDSTLILPLNMLSIDQDDFELLYTQA
jgi:hypothetical protein